MAVTDRPLVGETEELMLELAAVLAVTEGLAATLGETAELDVASAEVERLPEEEAVALPLGESEDCAAARQASAASSSAARGSSPRPRRRRAGAGAMAERGTGSAGDGRGSETRERAGHATRRRLPGGHAGAAGGRRQQAFQRTIEKSSNTGIFLNLKKKKKKKPKKFEKMPVG